MRTTLLLMLAALLCGCGATRIRIPERARDSDEPRASSPESSDRETDADVNNDTAGETENESETEPEPSTVVTEARPSDVRYRDDIVLGFMGAGFEEQLGGRNPEKIWWSSFDASLNDGNLWQDWLGMPGDIRLTGGLSYSEVQGTFSLDDGRRIGFEEERTSARIGLSYLVAAPRYRYFAEVEAQGGWNTNLGMDREDNVRGTRVTHHVPRVRILLGTGLIPQLLRPSQGGYSFAEFIGTWDTDSDVLWYRTTLAFTLWQDRSDGRNAWEVWRGMPPHGGDSLPWLAIRPRAFFQGFGGGDAGASWRTEAGGGLQLYSDKIGLSLVGTAGGGYSGWRYSAEIGWQPTVVLDWIQSERSYRPRRR